MKDKGVAFTGSARHVTHDQTLGDEFDGTTGYLIVDAGSIDEAVALAQGCPALEQGTRITVFDTLPRHEGPIARLS